MAKNNRNVSGAVIALLLIFLITVCNFNNFINVNAETNNNSNESNNQDSVDILFTHDLHSYLASYRGMHDGEVQNIGGVARLSTLIKQVKANNPDTLLIDGGDLVIGTLYQTLCAEEALEYRMLGELGFDATTFGNHDFDYNAEMLASMFNVASEKCDTLPALVECNFDWTTDNEETRIIYEAAKKCNLCDYTIVNKNGVNIAILGVFGKVATDDSPTLKINVLDQIESVKKTVDYIKTNENADMIVCISHSGVDTNIKKSEDEQLALAVPDIDVILSAHTHTLLEEPIVHGNTYIVSCGCYGEYTGLASFVKNDNGRWNLSNYKNIPMTEEIDEDGEIVNLLNEYDSLINEKYLADYNMTRDEVLVNNPYNFEPINDLYYVRGEHILGNFLSDAYRNIAILENAKSGLDDEKYIISVVPAGTVRGTFLKGDITVDDAFKAYSLGLGYDGKVGYPLVKIYVYGKDIKILPEIDASLSDLMPTANLYCSGIEYKIGLGRMFLNRSYDLKYVEDHVKDEYIDFKDDDLFVIVTDLYTAKMLGSVSRLSKGLINITPRLKDGTPIPMNESNDDYNWELAVMHSSNGTEIKTWYAIASYMEYWQENNSNGEIPEIYANLQGRKVVVEGFNLINFFSQTNRYFWLLSSIIIVFVGIIFLITVLIIKKIKGKSIKKIAKNKANN